MEDFRTIGARFSNWGRWGEEDRIGTLNHIAPEHLVAAAALIRHGRIFDLALPLDRNGPQMGLGGRTNPVHLLNCSPSDTESFNEHLIGPKGMINVDDFIMMPLQCATQWDGLAHVGYDNLFYNNVPEKTITTNAGSTRLSIHQTIAKGIAGRGVLLDIAALKGVDRLDPGYVITPEDMEAAERRQKVTAGPGDILLFRTGYLRHFTVDRAPGAYWNGEPGIDLSCVEWLHNRQIAALASDNWGIEVVPPNPERLIMQVHCVLIRDMGMTLGEMFDLDALAADCESDRVWEFFFIAPPLKVSNGVGSPITPIAIK
ncbi:MULTISPECIES: cyclase family protein [Sphingobium]|uniref:cyclase family protein n=1 Tax=Sphingobium sp. MI1205 TaxID=407020 RepID=UPI0007705491|nr:cyclase family protein [Sphingobium sp. MI1205]AMK19954.1 cyclase [Sphingobium sp. MI1205]